MLKSKQLKVRHKREKVDFTSSKVKRPLILAVLLLITCMVTGCKADENAKETKLSGEEQITISIMYPLELDHFKELVHTTYPNINLDVEKTTSATINGDSERRLRNNHGTDLVITTLPTGDVKEYVEDLSSMSFVNKYQASLQNPIMTDGQIRLLPLPGQYSGYILNQTLAEELGMPSFSSNEELLDLLAAGKERQIGIGEDGNAFGLLTVDTASFGAYIVGSQVPDFLGEAEGIKWLSSFEEKTESLSGAWNGCMDLLLKMTEQGYLNPASISLKKHNALPVRERMLSGTMLLCYGNVKLFTELNNTSESYEYSMLPFQSSMGNPSWVTDAPDAFIGINRTLEESDPMKADACRQILSLLSTEEGQKAWMADTMATTSYLNSSIRSENAVPEGLKECVEGGYVYNMRIPDNLIRYFGECMVSVLSDQSTIEESLLKVDDYYINGSAEVDYNQSVVGSVSTDLLYEDYNTRQEETAVGNLIADAAAEVVGTEMAVINGGAIRGSLYKGDVTGSDLTAVCPYENKLITVEVNGKTIWEMLENGISQLNREDSVPAGRFLQVSGFCYSYAPPSDGAPARLLSVTLPEGDAIDPEGHYTMAITSYMAGESGYLDNNGDGFTMLNLYSEDEPLAADVKLLKETEFTYAGVLKEYFANHRSEEITADLEGRITIVGGGN